MYEVIPDGRRDFKLTKNSISSSQIRSSDIVALKQSSNNAIGLLAKSPNSDNDWYFKDIIHANNYWSGQRSIQACINQFSSPSNRIYKFDTIQEFALWLVKELNIPIPVDQGFRFVESKTGRFAKKPECNHSHNGCGIQEMAKVILDASRIPEFNDSERNFTRAQEGTRRALERLTDRFQRTYSEV
jgi:hypothetical protein